MNILEIIRGAFQTFLTFSTLSNYSSASMKAFIIIMIIIKCKHFFPFQFVHFMRVFFPSNINEWDDEVLIRVHRGFVFGSSLPITILVCHLRGGICRPIPLYFYFLVTFKPYFSLQQPSYLKPYCFTRVPNLIPSPRNSSFSLHIICALIHTLRSICTL